MAYLRNPKTIKCTCGRSLTLSDSMTNQCECGQFWNGCGQRLSSPRNWGEETGEAFDDRGGYIIGSGEEL
jgi:hypothetical protein